MLKIVRTRLQAVAANPSFLLGAVLIVSVTLLTLLPAGAPLLLDDFDQLPYVRSFESIWDAVTRPDCYGFFRPVKNLLFLAVARSGPLASAVRHGMAWALYLAASLLFVAYSRRLLRHRGWALACGLTWALAPTQVSAIAWLSCINILAMAVLLLAGMLLYDSAAADPTGMTGRGRAAGRFAGAAACFFAAIVSYEAAIMFPALLVLHDTFRGREGLRGLRRNLVRYAAFGLVALAAIALRLAASGKMVTGGDGFSPMTSLQTSFAAAYFFLDHLALWLFPVGRQEILGTFVWGGTAPPYGLGLAWILLLGILVVLGLLWRRAPLIAFGMFWYFAALSPMSNLIPLRNGPVADYYLVVPSMGLALALAAMARRLTGIARSAPRGNARRKAVIGTLLVLALWRGGLAGVAFEWARTWHRPAMLLQRSMEAGAHAFRAQANLARMMKNAGLLDSARALARESARTAPWYDLPHNVLGDIETREGHFDAACRHYARAIAAAPQRPYPHFAMAFVQETHLDMAPDAAAGYERVLALPWNPYSQTAALNLARLRALNGQVDEAIRILEEALEQVPDAKDLRHNLNIAYRQKAREESS